MINEERTWFRCVVDNFVRIYMNSIDLLVGVIWERTSSNISVNYSLHLVNPLSSPLEKDGEVKIVDRSNLLIYWRICCF
jgi:hypothetical protein